MVWIGAFGGTDGLCQRAPSHSLRPGDWTWFCSLLVETKPENALTGNTERLLRDMLWAFTL